MDETAGTIQSFAQKELFTIKQFCKPGRWPSENAIRALILDASWGKNNFQKAFIRVNRRVLVDPIEFWTAVSLMQKEKK